MPDFTSPATTSGAFQARLAALAFERENAAAYREWSRMSPQERHAAMTQPDVLLAVVTHAAHLLAQHGDAASEGEGFAAEMRARLDAVAADLRAAQREFPREWFQALERWAGSALDHLHFDLAAHALRLAFDTGAVRYPGLFQALRASEAELYARSGLAENAAEIALWYVRRPYLLPERRKLPQVYPRLMAALLFTGHVDEHRQLLWCGLREAYLRPDSRDWFAKKIRTAYRGYLNVFFRSGARLDDRAQLLAHLLFSAARGVRPLRLLRLHRPLYWMAAALGYELSWRSIRHAARDAAAAPLNAILVTRAMGGIGDLLMMTPGLCALARAYPEAEIHFAVPRQFFPLLAGNREFSCIDIESASLDPGRYRAWFDLTDCPAARFEGRHVPNVRVGRIELFARAFGFPVRKVRGAAARPRYVVSPAEQHAAEQEVAPLRRAGRPLVGLQWQAADSYRDYPHNDELLRLLAARCNVLVFGTRGLPVAASEAVRVVARPLREAFALAAQCDVLVGPDSSFLHLAGALEKPMVLVAGPVNGVLRAKPYPSVVPIVPSRRDFPCAPCWRNENIDCYLSGRRESVCLRSIAPGAVAAKVFSLLVEKKAC
jgi:ADP-heptose:LPS heptosyltransferase